MIKRLLLLAAIGLLHLSAAPAARAAGTSPEYPANTVACNNTNAPGLVQPCSTTGTGLVVMNQSPTLITPNLGIPSFLDGRNIINLPFSSLTPCLPYQVVSNNLSSTASPICNSSLTVQTIIVPNTGNISTTGSGQVYGTINNIADVRGFGGVCDYISDSSAAVTAAMALGYVNVRLPKGCNYFPPGNAFPSYLTLYCESNQYSIVAATPVTASISSGAMSSAIGCATMSSFETNSVQPKNVLKIAASGVIANNSDSVQGGTFHSWNGEYSFKVGPTITSPVINIAFTTTLSIGATSGTITTLNFLAGNNTYSLNFPNGDQRQGTLSGTTMSWSGGLTATASTATVDMVMFTASVGGASSGTLSGTCLLVNPGNSPYWVLQFNEGLGNAPEIRSDVTITAGGGCPSGQGVAWSTSQGALAAHTIYGAQVLATDVPQFSFVSTGLGDNVFFSTNTTMAGTANAMRVVVDCSSTALTGTGACNSNGIYGFLGGSSFGHALSFLTIKDSNDGTLGSIAQNDIIISTLGNCGAGCTGGNAGGNGAGTAIYGTDTGYNAIVGGVAQGTVKDWMQVNSNYRTSGNFINFQQGGTPTGSNPPALAMSGDVFHADLNTAGGLTPTGNLLYGSNNNVTQASVAEATGNAFFNGTLTANGNTALGGWVSAAAGWHGPMVFDCTGTLSQASWGTSGICMSWNAVRTVTDSTSSTSLTTEASYSFQQTNLAFSNPTAVTNNALVYFPAPGCTTNCTAANSYSAFLAGGLHVGGQVDGAGFTNLFAAPPNLGGVTPAAATVTGLNVNNTATFSGVVNMDVGATAAVNVLTAGSSGNYNLMTGGTASGTATLGSASSTLALAAGTVTGGTGMSSFLNSFVFTTLTSGNGSGTTPTHVFTGATTTGLYWANPGIGFSVAGASVGTVTAAGLNGMAVSATTLSATGVSTLAGVTNAAAQTAGNIGEVYSVACPTSSGTQGITVTSISVASPAVVTWPSALPGAASGPTNWTCPVYLNSGTTIPTGLSAATQYWLIGSSVSGNTFQLASSDTNALAGTAINTSGSASSAVIMSFGFLEQISNTAYAGAELKLVAGDWVCSGSGSIYNSSTSTATVTYSSGISQSIQVRPTGGLGWLGYTTASVASATLGSSVEIPPITGVLENISSTTTLFVNDYVTTGQPTNFYLGGGMACQRIH